MQNKRNFKDREIVISKTTVIKIGNDYNEKSTKFLGESFMIRQVKHFLPVSCLKTLYFAMIHPFTTYGILAWGQASPTVLRKLSSCKKELLENKTKQLIIGILHLYINYQYLSKIHISIIMKSRKTIRPKAQIS